MNENERGVKQDLGHEFSIISDRGSERKKRERRTEMEKFTLRSNDMYIAAIF